MQEGDKPRGMIRLVCTKNRRLCCAHLLGYRAGEMLQGYVFATGRGLSVTAVSRRIHAYPTLWQAVKPACKFYYHIEGLFTGWLPELTGWLIRRGWFL